jgi:hypothetical protein
MGRTPKRRKRKSGFEVEWVKFPLRWFRRLREAGVGSATYHLAIVVLIENFKLEQMAIKEIVLSKEVTELSRRDRQRAINNLIRLKLIRVKRVIGKATRVIDLYI